MYCEESLNLYTSENKPLLRIILEQLRRWWAVVEVPRMAPDGGGAPPLDEFQ